MKHWSRLRAWFRRGKLESEMNDELRTHLEMQAEKFRADGLSAVEADYAARRQFGGLEQIKERCRDQRRWVRLELFAKEIGFAFRSLRRAPGFSLAVLLTLGLCIGPNTAILSALYTFVYKPLPFREPDRLVSITNEATRQGGAKRAASVVQATDFAVHADRFEGFAYFTAVNATLGTEDAPVRVNGMAVSASFFTVGVPLELGRPFAEDEQSPGKDHVVILSHRAWSKRHNADPAIIGRTIQLDAEAYTVIGVATPSFELLFDDVDFFRPYTLRPDDTNPLSRYASTARLVGRLKPGVTLAEARAQLAVLERTFYEQVAPPRWRSMLDEAGYRISVIPVREDLAEPVRAPLWLLQSGAALVLLLGCVNVASLLLARAATKRQELAIRHALGAGRATLLRQMLAESLLLVGLAGALGVGVAAGMLRVMNHYLPTVVRHVPPIALETRVLGIVLAVVTLMIVAMGVAPFALLWRSDLRPGETPQASTSRRGRRAIGGLVVGQVALALILLVSAGLLLRSFAQVMAVSPGFDAARVVHARVSLPSVRYKGEQEQLAVQQRILAGLAAIPAAEALGLSADFPIKERFNAMGFFTPSGVTAGTGQALVYYSSVSPGFFSTMGIRLEEGRLFRDDDDFRKTPVVIVDETFARRFFPGRNVVGMEMVFGTKPPLAGRPWMRIIGVVSRANLAGLEGRDGWPFVYTPFNQQPALGFSFMVRSSRPEAEVLNEMRSRVHAIDPGLAIYGEGVLAGSLDALLGNRRALLWLLGLFAGLALVLAAVGLYGVLNYDVAQRTREIGIRGAIGATRGQIVALILRQGLGKAALGLGLGAIGAALFTRALRKMLFDVSATDPIAYGGVGLLLFGVALAASWLPARRAAKVDPIVALRCE